MKRNLAISASMATALVASALVISACGAGPGAATTSRAAATAESHSSTPPTSGTHPAVSLVVIGDSIPFNSPSDCPGCTGFVDEYAKAMAQRLGRQVTTTNNSQHNGLTLPMLMAELPTFKDDLSKADAIIVGIAHNSFPMNDEKPCGSAFDEATTTVKDWSKVGPACAAAATAKYEPIYDKLFATVAGWRAGQPTILLTLNKYNDWIGWQQAHLTPVQAAKVVRLHDAWNAMLCRAAKRHGFTCADIYHAINGPDGTRPSADMLGADYTHPSQKGNDAIAEVLTRAGFDPLR